jgi:hypothetical protein
MTTPDHRPRIDEIKEQLPTISDLFGAGRPEPLMPTATFALADLFEVTFENPRLVLFTGVTHEGPSEPRIGWCLFGAARNLEGEWQSLPRSIQETIRNASAVRALQLLAVDHGESDEAAIEALKDPAAVSEIVSLADAAHDYGRSRIDPRHVEFGTYIYAITSGPARFAGQTVDRVCIGSPIRIAKQRRCRP